MTYAHKIKNHLLGIKCEHKCCKKAFLYGLMLFSNSFEEQKLRIYSENQLYINTVINLAKQLIEVDLEPYYSLISNKNENLYRILCTDKGICDKILDFFGYIPLYKSYVINDVNFGCEGCTAHFLRGAFLSCGNIFSPAKGYHTEFVFSRFNLSRDMYCFMKNASLDVKYTKRGSNYLVYCKESESIVDLLNLIGARDAAFDLMNKKIEREIRNSANRISNCELANIQKTVSSAHLQIEAIKKLKASFAFDALADKLKETATLRLLYPDLSISELSEKHTPPITKSCAGHRLKKLMELAEQL